MTYDPSSVSGAGHFFFNGGKNALERRFGRGIGSTAARQVASALGRVDYDTYVEPFLGRGDITRAIASHGKVVLNDLDCRRLQQAKAAQCGPGRNRTACALVSDPSTARCGADWRTLLKHDAPGTLFVLDPPWEGASARGMSYDRNAAIPAAEVVRSTRGLEGTVAIVYGDYPKARRELCHAPFTCHRIRRQFFGRPFTQLLAVKPARGAA